MADIFACLALSESFYRHEAFREFAGAGSVEEFLDFFWQQYFAKFDPNDLVAQLWTWLHNDLGDHADFGGDFDAALAAIRAPTIITHAETDSLFPLADSKDEASRIPNAKLRTIPTMWGHLAPYEPADQEFIDEALSDLLSMG